MADMAEAADTGPDTGADTGPDTGRTPWFLITALYVAGLIAAGQFAKISLTLTPLQAAYPDAPVAFAVSGVAVTGILFGVLAGGLVARLGTRRAVLWGLAGSALAGGAQALLPAFPVLMGLRVAEGAGHLLLVVAIPTMMAGLSTDRDRPLVMGLWATFFGVGFALAAVLIGDGLAPVYAGHAALAAGVGAILWRALPRVPVAPSAPPRLADHLVIYTTPRLFAPGLGHGLYATLFLALVTFLPPLFGSPWLSPVLPLAGLAGSLLAGPLMRRLPPGRLVGGGFMALACAFGLVWMAGDAGAYLAIPAMALSGVVAAAGFAAVPWLNPTMADRARANGAMAQLGNVGTFSGTPVIAAAGAAALLPITIALCVFAALLTGLAYRAASRR